MKKKLTIVIALLLCFAMAMPVFAAETSQYLFDEQGMVSSSSEEELNAKAKAMHEKYGMVTSYIIIADTGDTNTIDFTEKYYKEKFGKTPGIMLIQTDTLWYIHTQGKASKVFDEADKEAMWDACSSQDYYNEGADAFLDKAAELMDQEGIAAKEETEPVAVQEDNHPARLADDADLLSDSEETELIRELDRISEDQGCDVVIVTTPSLDGKTSQAYADGCFEQNGYGMGEEDHGILFLICPADRDWAITTHAFAITAFTDAGQEYIMEQVIPYLSNDDYASAFDVFAEQCDIFIEQAQSGEPYDVGNMPDNISPGGYILWLFPCFGVSAVISLFLKKRKRKSLKNVRFRADAADYLEAREITYESDRFLYRTITTVKIKSDDDDDNSSGGSTVHISSSGRTFGGSSGKY